MKKYLNLFTQFLLFLDPFSVPHEVRPSTTNAVPKERTGGAPDGQEKQAAQVRAL